jgi:Pyridoxamine 5'-phosphate oxidase
VPVIWSDAEDAILGGDLAVALAYLTPAGGTVVAVVAPIGLRDRAAGQVTFTTSLGFGRKLERIRANPKVALAYHAREGGFATEPRFVLVQGTATFDTDPDRAFLEDVVGAAAEPFMGEPKRGRIFWDRWLREYYSERVLVTVTVDRLTSWPDLSCAGAPQVTGPPLAAEPPASQKAPGKGTGPRIDTARAAGRLRKLPHVLAGVQGADGFPVVVPVEVGTDDARGMRLNARPGLLPLGARRAGLLGHRFNPKLIGLEARQHTGWLEVGDDSGAALYAPHTEAGFRAPAQKTLLLLGNGFLAKQGLRRARRPAA